MTIGELSTLVGALSFQTHHVLAMVQIRRILETLPPDAEAPRYLWDDNGTLINHDGAAAAVYFAGRVDGIWVATLSETERIAAKKVNQPAGKLTTYTITDDLLAPTEGTC